MRLRIHHPLFSGFLGVVGLLVLVTVVVAGAGLRSELVAVHRIEMRRQLDLSAELLVAFDGVNADSVADFFRDRIGYRITLLAEDGTVLADSERTREQTVEMESHRTRPEIAQALSGGTGFARRESATLGQSYLYGARLVRTDSARYVLRIAAPMEEIERSVATTRQTLLFAGVLALVLALVVSYGLSRILANPLVTLVDRAKALSAGDFSQRAPRKLRVTELDELSAAFNRLSDELQAHLNELGSERDEMEALIDCMAEGVIALTDDARLLRTNRAAKRLFALPEAPTFAPIGTLIRQPELRGLLEHAVVEPFQAREVQMGERHLIASARPMDRGGAVVTFLDITEIRRLEQVRRDFVANASHELKTPLTSMRGFAETLLESDPPEHLRREFLGTIRNNALRLQKIVDDLLDLSRLESGGWSAAGESVEIGSIARRSWEEVLDTVKEKPDLEFAIHGRGEAFADPDGLSHIFRNLFENAVRYTPAGGEVRVEIGDQPGVGGMWRVSVCDTGSGVPAAALPRLFERFYRVDTSRARDAGGTGLGLAIVRHLVLSMGGQVSAASQLGQGTTIAFTLPKERRGEERSEP